MAPEKIFQRNYEKWQIDNREKWRKWFHWEAAVSQLRDQRERERERKRERESERERERERDRLRDTGERERERERGRERDERVWCLRNSNTSLRDLNFWKKFTEVDGKKPTILVLLYFAWFKLYKIVPLLRSWLECGWNWISNWLRLDFLNPKESSFEWWSRREKFCTQYRKSLQ